MEKWDKTKSYVKYDEVDYSGDIFVALRDVPPGTEISNKSMWMLILANGSFVNHESYQMLLIGKNGGGGTDPELVQRVNVLEALTRSMNEDMNTMSSDVSGMKTDVETLKTAQSGDETAINSLMVAVQGKADQSSVTALETAVQGKADQSSVTALETAVQGKADQSSVTALETAVQGKQAQLTQGTNIALIPLPDGTVQISAAGTPITSVSWEDVTGKPSDLVQDPNYVHTDNNFTSAEKTLLSNVETQIQRKANQSDLVTLDEKVTAIDTDIDDVIEWNKDNMETWTNTYLKSYKPYLS